MTAPDTPGHRPVPGPVDRETFWEAQRRHRRASGWYTLLAGVATALMGIPLSALLSPLVYGAALIGIDVAGVFTNVPDVLAGFDSDGGSGSSHITPLRVVAIALAVVLPGAIVLFASWLTVRRLFRRGGAGAALLGLGARDPDATVLEERQLVNVVAEMATAAGVPPPAVKLLDNPVPNAAIIGSSLDDATVLVTTALLDTLGRDETQAVVGHLVGSAGNGDLRIGMTIASLFQTLGMVSSFLGAPVDRTARKNVRMLLGYVLRPSRRRDPAAVGAMADMLADAELASERAGGPDEQPGCLSVVTVPFLMNSAAFAMNRMVFMMFLVNPLMRRGWRARRDLADASAVELTRNPDALARALRVLGERGGPVPGASWAAHLFVVGAPTAIAGASQPDVADFQPPLPQRIARVERLGARSDGGLPTAVGSSRPGCVTAALVVLFPVVIAFYLFMLGIAVFLTGLALMIDMMFLGPALALAHAGLRALA